MKIPLSTGIAVLLLSTGAFAQQPLAIPMRSQSPGQTGIDRAMCYSYANQHTGVVMARVSQAPEKPKTVKPGAVHPVAVAAPLPSAIAIRQCAEHQPTARVRVDPCRQSVAVQSHAERRNASRPESS